MSFKVRGDDLALYVFLIASLFDGIVFEIIGVGALVYLIYFQIRFGTDNYYSQQDKRFCVFAIFIAVAYVIVQIVLLKLNGTEIVKLYGVTKTVLALPIIYFAIGPSLNTDDKVKKIFPLIIIINVIQLLYMISGLEFLNILSGRSNYIGAIDILFLPYVLKFGDVKNKYQRGLFLLIFFLQLFVSGSRSVLLIAVIMVFFLVIAEKNLQRKLVYILLFVIASIFVFYLAATNDYLSRALSVFSDRSDAARTGLFMFAERQYAAYSPLKQLIGNGDVMVLSQTKPVHNVFWELLLCYGKVGLCLWIAYTVLLIIKCVIRKLNNKYYLLLLTGCTLLVGYVQPFLTTGFLYQVLFSIVILQIYCSSIREEKL